MEEAKAAAYYDELTRKGEGAARFKQGLGFSSSTTSRANDHAVPARGSALPSSSSFLSTFVKASSPTKAAEFQKQAQLETIQNKLKKKPSPSDNHHSSRVSRRNDERIEPERERSRRRSSSRERDTYRKSRKRSRSRSRSRDERGSRHRRRSLSRDRDRYRDRDRDRRKRRSRSRSVSDSDRGSWRDRGRGKSRSLSPHCDRRSRKSNGGEGGIDYARMIEGYDKMTPAEKVKAKMKLQLSETAEKDAANGMGSGWERFDFDKDAPLDEEEIEAVEDDALLVKHIGQSFRFSAVEARREENIKAAHDEAMFGASSSSTTTVPSINITTNNELAEEDEENNKNESANSATAVASLISDKVLTMQPGSWRNRARKA